MEFIIVLGNSKEKTRKSRVDAAVEHFRRLPETTALLIFSGKGSGAISEAESMRDYAISLGVTDKACIIEDKSMTTVENIDCVLELLISNKWFNPTFFTSYTFTICTSKFHAPRSLLIALTRLSKYGKVQIIHDSDEGTKEIRGRETIFLKQQASKEVKRCQPLL